MSALIISSPFLISTLTSTAFIDYDDRSRDGNIPQNSAPEDNSCINVNTFSDRDVENNETFLIELDSFDSVIVTDNTAIANIMDNDGKTLFITTTSQWMCRVSLKLNLPYPIIIPLIFKGC